MVPRLRFAGDAMTVGGQARALAFAPGTSRLVALGNAHTLRVWDLPSTKPSRTIAGAGGIASFAGLAFETPDRVVVHDGRGFVRLDLASGQSADVALTLPPRPRGSYPSEVVIGPGARLAVIVERPSALLLVDLVARSVRELSRAVPSALLDEAGLPTSGDAAFDPNALAITAAGTVVAVGRVLAEGANPLWVVRRWSGAGEDLSLRRLAAEGTFEPNAHIFFNGGLAVDETGTFAVKCNGAAAFIDLATGAARILPVPHGVLDDTHVEAGALAGGGRTFVGATRAGLLSWDVASGVLQKVRAFEERCFVLCAAVSEAEGVFAGADDNGIVLHRLDDLAPIGAAKGHRNPLRVMAVCPRERHIATSDGSVLKMWHAGSGELVWDRRSHAWASMAFSPDGERLVADSQLFDVRTGETVGGAEIGDGTAHAWLADGRIVSVGYREMDQGHEVLFTEGVEREGLVGVPCGYLRCVPSISRDGRRALLHSETVAYAFDVERRSPLWSRDIEIVAVSLSPDGKHAALSTIGGRDVALIAMETGETIATLELGWPEMIEHVAFGEDGRIAVGRADGSIALFSFRPDEAAVTRHADLAGGHDGTIGGLVFGRGDLLVSAANDGSICLWRTGRG